jgi:hypothetical protein
MQLPSLTYLPPAVMNTEESQLIGFCTSLAYLFIHPFCTD